MIGNGADKTNPSSAEGIDQRRASSSSTCSRRSSDEEGEDFFKIFEDHCCYSHFVGGKQKRRIGGLRGRLAKGMQAHPAVEGETGAQREDAHRQPRQREPIHTDGERTPLGGLSPTPAKDRMHDVGDEGVVAGEPMAAGTDGTLPRLRRPERGEEPLEEEEAVAIDDDMADVSAAVCTPTAADSAAEEVDCRGSNLEEGKAMKTRKPYTITKQRERWTDTEHQLFIEGIKLHGRQWRKIEQHVGSKTSVQIRSHAQKFFTKLERQQAAGNRAEADGISIPPPRPKRKPSRPYPKKGDSGTAEETSRQQLPILHPIATTVATSTTATIPGATAAQLMQGNKRAASDEAAIAAVAAAASAAAAAAAAAVVAAASDDIKSYLQMHPPQGFPFFGAPPSLLAYVATMQMPRCQMNQNWQDTLPSLCNPICDPTATDAKHEKIPITEAQPQGPNSLSALIARAEKLKVTGSPLAPDQTEQDRANGHTAITVDSGASKSQVLPKPIPDISRGIENGMMQKIPPLACGSQDWWPSMDYETRAAVTSAFWQLMQAGMNKCAVSEPALQGSSQSDTCTNGMPPLPRRPQCTDKLRGRSAVALDGDESVGSERKRPKQLSSPNETCSDFEGLQHVPSTSAEVGIVASDAIGRSASIERPVGWNFGQLSGAGFNNGNAPLLPLVRPCGSSLNINSVQNGNGSGSAYGHSYASNMNESFVGSNVVNSWTGPSSAMSLTSSAKRGDVERTNGHNGQSSWSNVGGVDTETSGTCFIEPGQGTGGQSMVVQRGPSGNGAPGLPPDHCPKQSVPFATPIAAWPGSSQPLAGFCDGNGIIPNGQVNGTGCSGGEGPGKQSSMQPGNPGPPLPQLLSVLQSQLGINPYFLPAYSQQLSLQNRNITQPQRPEDGIPVSAPQATLPRPPAMNPLDPGACAQLLHLLMQFRGQNIPAPGFDPHKHGSQETQNGFQTPADRTRAES